uniref:Apoptosis inhibitor IAP n=1 Tax=Cacopsylla melanoneura TaxID=428564 RepID=A0A8D8ZDZ7_9HEMI
MDIILAVYYYIHDKNMTHTSKTKAISELSTLPQYVPKVKPMHAQYATPDARLKSFETWPLCMKGLVNRAVEAGLFYLGTSDHLMCFQCGGGLHQWILDEDPWDAHVSLFSQCEYVRTLRPTQLQNFQKTPTNIETKSLPSSTTKRNEALVCKACYVNECNILVLPCLHMSVCGHCSVLLDKCIMCRVKISGSLPVFV